ncbi:PASTA domain-containing protein [Streptomyces sp. NPDC006997]|uniref:PASTA domain-containing protein n=1 Tax=Streptomyces sp. NPDC006997 TaxID=3155356 RepID=UPI00340364BC
MRTRTTAAALIATALLVLTACESTDDTGPTKPDTTAEHTSGQPKQDTDSPEADTETPTEDDKADTAKLPNLVGKDLQAAQDEAQAAGFYVLDDQDASGQNRLQILDRNWTVCNQDPAPGTHPTDTLVTLFAVKDDESC